MTGDRNVADFAEAAALAKRAEITRVAALEWRKYQREHQATAKTLGACLCEFNQQVYRARPAVEGCGHATNRSSAP